MNESVMSVFTKRQRKIALYLINSKVPVTAKWIAKELNVSDRTIRNELRLIQDVSDSLGFKIKLLHRKGYVIETTDESKYNEFLIELNKIEEKDQEIDFNEQENRVFYLLNRFLLENSYIKIEALEEAMYVSKSTIQNDLRIVRKILSDYKLSLENRPHYGLYIKGEEFMKRVCLTNYLYKKTEDTNSQNVSVPFFDENLYMKINEAIVEKANKYKIEMTDISLENLTIHILIACERIKEGFIIDQPLIDLDMEYSFEKVVADEIVSEIKTITGLHFPESEVNYIIVHLSGTKLLHHDSLSNYGQFDEVESIVQCMLNRLESELNWKLHDDLDFIKALTLHIRPTMNRLRYNMNIRNPLLDEIKVKYPAAFAGAMIASQCIEEYLDMDVEEHEIAYIALHIGVALEKKKSEYRKIKRVLLVCASGLGSAKLLYYRLSHLFEEELQIVNILSYYKITEADLSSIDFVISTIPIKDNIKKPVIVVNMFLEDEDIQNVKEFLSLSKLPHENNQFIDESRLFVKKDFSTKAEVIHFLSDYLIREGLVPTHYEQLILDRENVAPTSLGNLVAVPHPTIPVTTSTFWTVCTLKTPIEWADKQMVQLVCLLNIKEKNTTDLDEMYKKLITIIENKEIVQKILESNSPEEILTLLK